MSEFKSVNIRLATESDAHLPTYDFTKLSAINTCPTWGILRYTHHKTMASGNRAMALELGGTAHEAFAAVRLYQLGTSQGHEALMDYHGRRLFGDDRWQNMRDATDFGDEPNATSAINLAFQSVYSSGYHDDPQDRGRTVANLEEALIGYIDEWQFDRYPVWIADANDPKSDVGIEVPLDVVVVYTRHDDTLLTLRYTGKMDGIHTDDNGKTIIVNENKTTSRISDSWAMSFEMSHQVTGYCMAVSLWTKQHCRKAHVLGLQIPLPKAVSNGIKRIHLTRDQHMFTQFFRWLYHTVSLEQQYTADPAHAPKYTHSCKRYFQSCMMIPYCVADDDEKSIIYDEMNVEEWSPLAEKNDA